MPFYKNLFDAVGLGQWCQSKKADGPLTMDQLLAITDGEKEFSIWETPFPSLDNLHESCAGMPQTRDITSGLEQAFLDIKPPLQTVLDPITQPLSWMLDGTLYLFAQTPWWLFIPLMVAITRATTQSWRLSFFVLGSFLALAFIDHYFYTVQTLSIIFVCTLISVFIGVPIGIAMSKCDRLKKYMTPVLDTLQTLPSFVYLIPLIYLFSVTESKLYGIAIILYAIVPVIRLTDLGIRLVSKEVIEAANAYGLNDRQKLFGVEIPLALPNIMAGVNQTIMMALAMVVIASLVSAPGLGVLVLRGIRNLELGVGLVSGLCIVLLAVMLDRVSKATLARINTVYKH